MAQELNCGLFTDIELAASLTLLDTIFLVVVMMVVILMVVIMIMVFRRVSMMTGDGDIEGPLPTLMGRP